MILCGDLNVAHQEIDLKNPKTNKKTPGFTQEERDGFTKLLSLGFVDTFRHIHGSETDCYTFWSYRGNNNRGNDVGWYVINDQQYCALLKQNDSFSAGVWTTL